jgi:hypothetical protein
MSSLGQFMLIILSKSYTACFITIFDTFISASTEIFFTKC